MLNLDEGLAGALARLERILVRSRAAIVPLLRPGIDAAEVATLLASVGLSPSAEAVAWFGWHDGAGSPGVPTTAIELVPDGEFYDLRHLCDEYVMTRSADSDVAAMPGSVYDVEQLWPTHWFPLLRLLGKGYLAVDLAANEGSTSPVHIVWHDTDLDERADWESVGSFVETVIDRFEQGVYSVDDDGIVRGPTIDHPTR